MSCDETFYPLTDNLGSLNILTDSTGAVVLTQHFLPFGEDFESPKPTVDPTACNNGDTWPYGFTGQYHDAETSLIYFHARYYNPAIGHFMSPDSVIPNPNDTYSYDRYAYCRNNPVNLTDPTGHFWFAAAIIIGALIGGVSAALVGGNILQGMLLGAIAGAAFYGVGPAGLNLQGGQLFFANAAISAAVGAADAALSGGDPLRGALMGAVSSMAAGGAAKLGTSLGLKAAGKNILAVLSAGVVGGAINAAGGGDFWQGFATSAAIAGMSLAANEIAGAIQEHSELSAARDDLIWRNLTPEQAQEQFANLTAGMPRKAGDMLFLKQIGEKDYQILLKPGLTPYQLKVAGGGSTAAHALAHILASPEHHIFNFGPMKDKYPGYTEPGGLVSYIDPSFKGGMIYGEYQTPVTNLWHEMGHHMFGVFPAGSLHVISGDTIPISPLARLPDVRAFPRLGRSWEIAEPRRH